MFVVSPLLVTFDLPVRVLQRVKFSTQTRPEKKFKPSRSQHVVELAGLLLPELVVSGGHELQSDHFKSVPKITVNFYGHHTF